MRFIAIRQRSLLRFNDSNSDVKVQVIRNNYKRIITHIFNPKKK